MASLWLSLWLRDLEEQLKNEETPSSSGKTGQNRVVEAGADERARTADLLITNRTFLKLKPRRLCAAPGAVLGVYGRSGQGELLLWRS